MQNCKTINIALKKFYIYQGINNILLLLFAAVAAVHVILRKRRERERENIPFLYVKVKYDCSSLVRVDYSYLIVSLRSTYIPQ